MRILIVEDNAFNAYCLRRLLESVVAKVMVTIVNNSQAALSLMNANPADMVVIDGDLGAVQDGYCNGPELAHLLLKKFPLLPLIAWSDSDFMRDEFAVVFNQHLQSLNEYNSWTKAISLERIYKTWAYYFGEFMAGQSEAFSSQSKHVITSKSSGKR
ncbi:response regulator [uncultured Legionella sp.]|uniref:response regulator n=1 Tax=uncultured Legionella sp. TaxID=210934 RepID=UPI00261ACF7F|nr:response regulator [uncultured Legionella sp.]